jgi:hypothetical protein
VEKRWEKYAPKAPARCKATAVPLFADYLFNTRITAENSPFFTFSKFEPS